MSSEQDHYLVNRPRQPKAEIADYVEGEGILVPQRFKSMREAVISGLPIIVRSEHPQDYDGASEIMHSPTPDNRQRDLMINVSQTEYEQWLIADMGNRIAIYCSAVGLKPEDFTKDISYSYWERIGGLNRVIVADSAIKDRYHIFTSDRIMGDIDNHSIVEKGSIIFNGPKARVLESSLTEPFPALIEFYEQIKHLPRFNSNHCPIIETKTHQGKIYFLQYHRTRDFAEAGFVIDREPNDEEIGPLFVRGATPPEGKTYNVRYGGFESCRADCIAGENKSCLGNNCLGLFDGIMSSKKEALFLVDYSSDTPKGIPVAGHYMRSKLFKPGIFIILDGGSLKSKILSRFKDFDPNDHATIPTFIQLRIIADGKRAYTKLLNPNPNPIDDPVNTPGI